jgi:hypothetical protein
MLVLAPQTGPFYHAGLFHHETRQRYCMIIKEMETSVRYDTVFTTGEDTCNF